MLDVGNTMKMKIHIVLAVALDLVVATVVIADEIARYHDSATPKSLTEWCKADDGKVSTCFMVDKTTFGTNEIVKVRCAVRNITDKTITILRPFGDSFYAHSTGLKILGPDGPIPYRGAMKEYVLGTSSFVELKPHTVVDETLELPVDIFPGLHKAGLYIISYVFLSDGYPKQPLPEGFWKGQIKTSCITILMK